MHKIIQFSVAKKNYIRLGILILASVLMLGLFFYNPYDYAYKPTTQYSNFEDFYAAKLSASKMKNVRSGNEERLDRYSDQPGEYAILAIHGFGSSRAETEYIVEKISQKYKANTYYLRLPGHGTNMIDHASVGFEDYMDCVEEAFSRMPFLGKKIILIGSSTGGTLATWLASRYPDQVYALILGSPFYDFADPMAGLLDVPGFITIGKLVLGEERDASKKDNRKLEGYENFWLTRQKYSALGPLNEVQNFVNRDIVFQKISAPVLMMYYYKDEDNKEETVSIEAMLEAMHKFGTLKSVNGSIQTSPFNRAVAVEDGDHALFSKYVRTDKEFILSEILSFLEDVAHGSKRLN